MVFVGVPSLFFKVPDVFAFFVLKVLLSDVSLLGVASICCLFLFCFFWVCVLHLCRSVLFFVASVVFVQLLRGCFKFASCLFLFFSPHLVFILR